MDLQSHVTRWEPPPDEAKRRAKTAERVAKFTTTVPLPRSDWPPLAHAVAKFATPDDIGIGSTIERNLGTAGEWFKSAMTALAGGCRCTARRDWLNARYPYR